MGTKCEKIINNVIKQASGIVQSINNMYLCSRKSGYCAGLSANNTLIKSDLTFRKEVVSVSF